MNQYSVDFILKIEKMILNEHISKKSIMRQYNIATKTYKNLKKREKLYNLNHKILGGFLKFV